MTTSDAAQPKFDPNAHHMEHPRLRPVRGFRAQAGEQEALGLADARQVSDRVVFTAPAAQLILPLMDGKKSINEIVAQVGRGLTRPDVEGLVAQLDHAGLLFGPTFDAMLQKMRKEFDSATALPPGTTAALADALVEADFQQRGQTATDEDKSANAAAKLREAMDAWIAAALKDVPNPSLDTLPAGIVAPHIDYPRGWLNYASVWGRLRVADRPDRVIILGTNHFGEGTGVTGCDKGYESPLGVCPVDTQLLDTLKKHLGADNATKLLANRYDHEREHSIELQIPWIQHCLGAGDDGSFCKVFGVLIHDPTVKDGESYDGNGLALEPFIKAMKATIAELPGRTLIVSSADLSHVGPAFGDQQTLAGDDQQANDARNRVFAHDRDMIQLIMERKPDELVAAMSWQQNPTRWCSIGNLVAALKIVEPTSVDLYNFAASMDEQGTTLVSNVGMALNK
ncbi:MAG TPA: AmmeMemoRadiSam system protein B [Phycisphaerales bacterium]|nr:AmmeMemoRadiSam system protein B [Phycisphaerales bacterium]